MKLNPAFVFSLLALLTSSLVQAEPFTYQGRLENSGVPYTGTVSIRLSLYSALTGGSQLKTQTFDGVTVTSGVFTVAATAMSASDFNGAARYFNIEVSSDGINWTALSPRQEVTWAPMAMHAKVAETVTGAVPAGQLTGTLNPAILGTGSVSGTVTFAPASGAPFSVSSNTTKVTNLNSDLFDGLDSASFLLKSGGTMTGDLAFSDTTGIHFGATVRQMLNLWGTGYGIGVQGDTLYQRTNNDFSWFQGGIHSDVRNSPGAGGTEAMRLISATNTLWLRPGTSATPRGRILFGDLHATNSNPYVSIGEAQDDDDTLDITAKQLRFFTNRSSPFSVSLPGTMSSPAAITFGQSIGQTLTFFQNATENFGIGVQGYTQYFRTSEQFSWYKGGVHANNRGDPGAGGTTLMTLDASGNLTLGGTLSTTVLTIRGGADVAEPFESTRPDELEPGTVVVIDEDHAGKLKRSTGSYDTRVAGIVSGAGGVKPGLRLQQDGILEGSHPVALSGRVYVKADASTGGIRPGDLLTTSATPGHAMKVTDTNKAQGAILGKAMTALESGTGLVLVLVTLQ